MSADCTYILPSLPLIQGIETESVLRSLVTAHRYLSGVKGSALSIPNQGILIDTLSLQEAKSSSEIENIVTTQDELFVAGLYPERLQSGPAKEVERYRSALKMGFSDMVNNKGLITNNSLIGLFRHLKQHDGGFRDTPGTVLRNELTGDNVYIPPQSPDEIISQMSALEHFVNDDDNELDPLVKMALIHHQFESIHPFPDGNGRIGRILNVLYLTRVGLLDIPILYLSRAINDTRDDYYRGLQAVRETGNWEPWLLYILDAVAMTSRDTLRVIDGIRSLMSEYKLFLRENHGKIYSQDLLNNLFRHPYTRIEFVQSDLGVSRPTASKYLDELSGSGLLEMHRSGTSKYFVNTRLVSLLSE